MFENFITEAEVINRYNISPILYYNLKNKYKLEVNCKGEIDTFDSSFDQMIGDLKSKQGKTIIDFKDELVYVICEIAKHNIKHYFNVLSIDSFAVISYYNTFIEDRPYLTTKTHIELQQGVFRHIQDNILHTLLVFKDQLEGNAHTTSTMYEVDLELVFSVFREESFNVISKSSKAAILKCFSEINVDIERVHNEYMKHLEIIN